MTALRKVFISALSRSGLLMLFFTCVFVFRAQAQIPIAIGTGTSSNDMYDNPCPLQDLYQGSRMQFLYLASELKDAGMDSGFINAISYQVLSIASGSNTAMEQMVIKIGSTSSGALDMNSWLPGTTQVYGPVDYKAIKGSNVFLFSQPFLWNGHDNIVIEICNGDGSGEYKGSSNPAVTWTQSLDFTSTHVYINSDNGNLCNTPFTDSWTPVNTRPNIVFEWTPATLCTATPLAGNAVTTASSVCSGESFFLSLQGNTIAGGISYQWQSSADNSTWADIPGATSYSYKTAQQATAYYRAAVKCTAAGVVTYSTPVYVYTGPLQSGHYTINKDQSAGNGNFQSFTDAYNFIRCGINGSVVFDVTSTSGSYQEQLIMGYIPGSSATNTVTFNGNGQVLEYTSFENSERAVVKLDGAHHVRFNNLVIRANGTGDGQYGFGVHLLNNADSNTIHNCVITADTVYGSDRFGGIVMNASATELMTFDDAKCDSNTISDNIITGGYAGIVMMGSTSVSNMRNVFSRNTVREFNRYGIYISSSFSSVVEGNTFTRFNRIENLAEVTGICVESISTRLKITGNTITGLIGENSYPVERLYGIKFYFVEALSGLDNLVSNNLVYHLGQGSEIYAIYNYNSGNASYYNNTLSMDGDNSIAAQMRGAWFDGEAGGLNFVNNIISISGNGPGNKVCIYMENPAIEIAASHNNYYVAAGTGGVTGIGYFNHLTATSLLAWQAASGLDAGSFSINPIYTSLAAGNFRPLNASIDNRGAYTSLVPVDITGVTRDANNPDLGVYETTPPACTAPPLAGHVVMSNDTVCVNSAVMLSVEGYSNGRGQTFQWQVAASAAGPFTNLGAELSAPDTLIKPAESMYYRAQITCSGLSAYTDTMLLVTRSVMAGGVYTLDRNAAIGVVDFNSFNQVKDALSCGILDDIVINVIPGSGTYNEQLILDTVPGASANATVTFKGNGNTISFGSVNSEERATVMLNGADYFVFDSLTVEVSGNGDYGYGIQLTNDADNNVFRHCTVKVPLDKLSDAYNGIVISAWRNMATVPGEALCDSNVFDGNTIIGGYNGIAADGSQDSPLLNNRFTNNLVQDFGANGFYIENSTGTLIENNRITRPNRTEVDYNMYAITIYGKTARMVVNANRIYNLYGAIPDYYGDMYGIAINNADTRPGDDNLISNNLLYQLNGGGSWTAFSNFNCSNIRYYHNTVAFDYTANTSNTYSYGFSLLGVLEGMEVMNNIITNTRGGTGDKVAVYSYAALDKTKMDYNDYYINGAGGNNHLFYVNRYFDALDAWQGASLLDMHSLNIDPVYSAPAIGNYAPAISPLDNSGTAVPVSTDITGASRNAITPDMGAYEISLQPCTAPPVAGTAAAVPDAGMCMGTVIDLHLTGNSTGGMQTYQWQDSIAGVPGWKNVGSLQYVPDVQVRVMHSSFYRCVVVCGTDTAMSSLTLVTINAPLPAGTYIIDKNGSGDFLSFNAAVAAMECGIGGAVTFRVKAANYYEQVRMHYVYGSSDTSRITFEAENGIPASVMLTNYAEQDEKNYLLILDSACYITFRNLFLRATGNEYGRVVVLRNTAAADSIVNCMLMAEITANYSTNMTVVYTDNLKGRGNVIKGNTIYNGSSGIYLDGSYNNFVPPMVLDSNTIKGFFTMGIGASRAKDLRITGNKLLMDGASGLTTYGMRVDDGDSSYRITDNVIEVKNAFNTTYGIYVSGNKASADKPGRVERNKILALENNTANLYGFSSLYGSNSYVRNNVISIQTSGELCYGIYDEATGNRYYNNAVQSNSSSPYDNYVAYFNNYSSDYGIPVVYNNIFSHKNGGQALFINDAGNYNGDYNMLYTSGSLLARRDADDIANLQEWRIAVQQDIYSVVYKPAFTDEATLQPAITDSTVWAMHGRGVQLADNTDDFYRRSRPVTLQEGVPDLGPYEFVPATLPVLAEAVPAAPAPGVRQVFMMGTDTVSAITWGPTVPQLLKVRRYSGVQPPSLAANTKYMYFYTTAEVVGGTAGSYALNQFYFDSWLGWIEDEELVRLGRTNEAGGWLVGAKSTVGTGYNVISEPELGYLGKFTGLPDTSTRVVDNGVMPADSSNRGTHFWVGYGHNYYFNVDNGQNMLLYLSAQEAANVTVRVHGTTWARQYHIPANTAIPSDFIPKYGIADARLMKEGKFDRGISIESDVPIVAYAHIYGEQSSGASLLLPTGTYGYEYYALTAPQLYSNENSYSWFYVIADHDSTLVEITPSCATLGGRPAKTPFTVLLNKGEVYQVLGAMKGGFSEEGFEVTGSRIRSVPNTSGKCYPVAVFSGNGRTSIICSGSRSGGDNIIQQNLPFQAWGQRYLTAGVPSPWDATTPVLSKYRVAIKDPSTIVKKNGEILSGLSPDNYYEFDTDGADYIEADKPVMIAQYMPSDGSCGPRYDAGDPEMVYLSPIEQGIKQVSFYRNNRYSIYMNYLVLIIPDAGLSSLVIDGGTDFDYVYQHPNLAGYSVVVERWNAEEATATASSDVPFTAVTYGLGDLESYGYNAGTLIRNLNAVSGFVNVYDSSGSNSKYTCKGTPFRFNLLLPVKPSEIKWMFSTVAALGLPADSIQVNPVALDSTLLNGRTYYRYSVNRDFVISAPGTYRIPVVFKHPTIESCDNSATAEVVVTVTEKPGIDFTTAYSGCLNDEAHFTAEAVNSTGTIIAQWKWDFDDNTGAGGKDTVKQFTAPGIYEVKLLAIGEDGCFADTVKKVEATPYAALNFEKDSVLVCKETPAVLTITNPEAGVTYNWYDALTGGNLVTTGSSYTINPVTGTISLYVEAVRNGCASPREKVTAALLQQLAAPVVKADSISATMIRFSWTEVADATGYEVSEDGGRSWKTPTGTPERIHVVSGLRAGQEVTLLVKAKGAGTCQDAVSEKVTATTLVDQVFIPNAFTPNGDGLNDVIRVYGFVVKEMTLVIFNQWGEKIFETRDQLTGWDGTWKGKPQPSGVYMYVCQVLLTDGSTQIKKGSINLVR